MYYPNQSAQFKDILKELQGKQCLVFGHLRPDGDSIGSQIGLTRCLNQQNITTKAVITDPIPKNIQPFTQNTPFIAAAELKDIQDYTLLYVDCADAHRVGESLPQPRPEIFLNIDHHISNTEYAQHNIVLSDSAATAEILASIMLDNKLTIDAHTAQALYIGIVMDTGQFAFPSTSANLLRIAAELIERGASPAKITHSLYEQDSLARIKLLRRFLKTFKLEIENKVCIGTIDQNAYAETGATKQDTEGFVNYTRSIDGICIGVLLEEKSNGIKGSLRAKEARYRVDQLAQHFNGGGHACAAGLSSPDSLETFYPKFLEVVQQHIANISEE